MRVRRRFERIIIARRLTVKKHFAAFAFAVAIMLINPPWSFVAHAQWPAQSTIVPSYSAEAEIASALYAASATQEAAQRLADARMRELMREIDGLRANAAQLTDVARVELARAEERFVAELAARDRAYAQEIAVFRAAVEDIASTREGLEALALFNAGRELEALAILDDLAAARARARQVRVDIETAADQRRNATLALEARSKGLLTTLDLIARYEAVTRLDPGVHWDWVELGRLYTAAGRLDPAADAARKSADTAGNDRDRSVALDALGDVLIAKGDGPGALAAYQRSLAIAERLAASDPANAGWQRDVSVSLWRLRRFPESGVTWADIAARMEAMDARGTLLPTDRQYLETARRNAGTSMGQTQD